MVPLLVLCHSVPWCRPNASTPWICGCALRGGDASAQHFLLFSLGLGFWYLEDLRSLNTASVLEISLWEGNEWTYGTSWTLSRLRAYNLDASSTKPKTHNFNSFGPQEPDLTMLLSGLTLVFVPDSWLTQLLVISLLSTPACVDNLNAVVVFIVCVSVDVDRGVRSGSVDSNLGYVTITSHPHLSSSREENHPGRDGTRRRMLPVGSSSLFVVLGVGRPAIATRSTQTQPIC